MDDREKSGSNGDRNSFFIFFIVTIVEEITRRASERGQKRNKETTGAITNAKGQTSKYAFIGRRHFIFEWPDDVQNVRLGPDEAKWKERVVSGFQSSVQQHTLCYVIILRNRSTTTKTTTKKTTTTTTTTSKNKPNQGRISRKETLSQKRKERKKTLPAANSIWVAEVSLESGEKSISGFRSQQQEQQQKKIKDSPEGNSRTK